MAELAMSAAATAKVSGAVALTDPKKANGGKAPDPDAFKKMLSLESNKAAEDSSEKVKTADPVVNKASLKFSNHALERMNTRGITFTPEQITNIENAAAKASQKGAKEALVLQDDKALIVSLKNNTIVTVMDRDTLKENVFTNIDSTVFA